MFSSSHLFSPRSRCKAFLGWVRSHVFVEFVIKKTCYFLRIYWNVIFYGLTCIGCINIGTLKKCVNVFVMNHSVNNVFSKALRTYKLQCKIFVWYMLVMYMLVYSCNCEIEFMYVCTYYWIYILIYKKQPRLNQYEKMSVWYKLLMGCKT